jgi:hypothetical protein
MTHQPLPALAIVLVDRRVPVLLPLHLLLPFGLIKREVCVDEGGAVTVMLFRLDPLCVL